jgi:hypothetical protein
MFIFERKGGDIVYIPPLLVYEGKNSGPPFLPASPSTTPPPFPLSLPFFPSLPSLLKSPFFPSLPSLLQSPFFPFLFPLLQYPSFSPSHHIFSSNISSCVVLHRTNEVFLTRFSLLLIFFLNLKFGFKYCRLTGRKNVRTGFPVTSTVIK